MTSILLKGIRSLLQYLQKAIKNEEESLDGDIIVLYEYLRFRTTNELEIKALAIIIKIRHSLVHDDVLTLEQWKDFSHALTILEIWYKTLKGNLDPLNLDPFSLTFALMREWVTREATVLQRYSIDENKEEEKGLEKGLEEGEEKVSLEENIIQEEKLEDFIVKDTLSTIRQNGWRQSLKGNTVAALIF